MPTTLPGQHQIRRRDPARSLRLWLVALPVLVLTPAAVVFGLLMLAATDGRSAWTLWSAWCALLCLWYSWVVLRDLVRPMWRGGAGLIEINDKRREHDQD